MKKTIKSLIRDIKKHVKNRDIIKTFTPNFCEKQGAENAKENNRSKQILERIICFFIYTNFIFKILCFDNAPDF